MKTNESGVTTALLAIITLNFRNRRLRHQHTVLGESSVTDEVRTLQRGQKWLNEAAKLGFTHATIPKGNKPKRAIEGMTIVAVEQAVEAMRS